MVRCRQCHNVFRVIGDALNSQLDTPILLESAAEAIVEQFGLKACHFRLLSRDQLTLEHCASFGLSDRFLGKGPVDAERSVAEALKGKIVIVPDCTSDSRVQYPQAFVDEGIKTMLTVPLETRGVVIGVMRLFASKVRDFKDEELEFFRVAAPFFTSSIIHSMFHGILDRVTESIRSTLELSDVLDSIVQVVVEELRVRGSVIQLLDKDMSLLEAKACYGLSKPFVERLPEVYSEQLVEEVLDGGCVSILNGRSDERVSLRQAIAYEKVSSILLIPLRSRGQALGVLSVFTHNPYEFSDEEKQLMIAIGEQCSLAIVNAMMFAALKSRYNTLVDDFNVWFESTCVHPGREPVA